MSRESVLKRIQAGSHNNKGVIDVTPRELRQEIARLAKSNDETGLMNVYDAMLEFERGSVEGESEKELTYRVKENMDLMAIAADQEAMGAKRIEALAMAADQIADTGKITSFYRRVLNFAPRSR